MTCRQRFLAAVRGEPVDRTPVFPLLMFLAADRAGISYRTFATDGQALAEAQLAVQQRFGVDAVTACSDAFRLSADLGGDMVFPEATPLSCATSARERIHAARGCRYMLSAGCEIPAQTTDEVFSAFCGAVRDTELTGGRNG